MVSSSERRSSRFRLVDGKEVEFFMGKMELDPSIDFETLKTKYGEHPKLPERPIGTIQSPEELRAFVEWYARKAEAILRSGEDHGWFSFYFRRGRLVDTRIHAAVDAQGKAAIAGEIARMALRKEYDLVVVLGEIWYSPIALTPDGAYIPPERHEARQEAMMIDALAKSGNEVWARIPFTVLGGEPPNRRVELGSIEFNSPPGMGILEPTRRAWGVERRRAGASFFKRR